MRLLHWSWLPTLDTFRTFVACPPTAIQVAFHEVRALANA